MRTGTHRASGQQCALLLQHLEDHARIDTELRQFRFFHFDINRLLLDTEQFYFLHFGNFQKLTTQCFRVFPFFLVGKIIPGERVNRAVNIIKPIIHERTDDPFRELAPNVIGEIAHIGPGRPHAFFGKIFAQPNVNNRGVPVGEAFDVIKPRRSSSSESKSRDLRADPSQRNSRCRRLRSKR